MSASLVRPEAAPREEQRLPARWLMLPVLGAPLLALVLHQAEYMLAPWACDAGARWVQHLVVLLVLAGMVGLGLLARGALARAPAADPLANSVEARGARRTRFLALVGLGSSAISGVLVLAYWIAVIVLDPCTRA